MNEHCIILMTPLPLTSIDTDVGTLSFIAYAGDTSIFQQADIICVTPFNNIDAVFIAQLPDNIKLIVNIGVGTEHIDLAAAWSKNIMVTNTPVVTEDTADLAFALILATSRRLTANESFLRNNQWSSKTPVGIIGQSVHSKILGIVGFGAIGQAVARRAQGFNMKVIYHNPSRKVEAEQSLSATYCESLAALLQQADIVSLHCPLSEDTRYLINEETLVLMKNTSVLINTGRGGLVDEQALVNALKNETISAAGLDVYENEPEVSETLKAQGNVTLLPHIGSATTECRTEMLQTMLGNVICYLLNKKDDMNIVGKHLTSVKVRG
ncbi:MAG: 2-hydroxyacid dehydrogenase [Cognaticolwellia sp.]